MTDANVFLRMVASDDRAVIAEDNLFRFFDAVTGVGIPGPPGNTGANGTTGPVGPTGTQGVQGIQGNAGPVGPAAFNPRGAWVQANAYSVGDVVTWGGSSYYVTVAKPSGSAPPTGTPSDPGTDDFATVAGWAYLAVQGAQGTQGVQGNTGVAGSNGVRGSKWFVGTGAPGTIAGSLPDDQYLDQATGDVYTLS